MNWEAISAISELLGILLVLVSIFYLAIQIRHNTDAIQGSTIHAVAEIQQNELRWASDISSVFTKAIENPSELDSNEAWKMNEWLIGAMAARQSEFFQFKKGLVGLEVWEASEQVILAMLSLPWTRNWWVTFGQKTYSKEFVDLVDMLFEKDVVLIDFKSMLQQLKTGGF